MYLNEITLTLNYIITYIANFHRRTTYKEVGIFIYINWRIALLSVKRDNSQWHKVRTWCWSHHLCILNIPLNGEIHIAKDFLTKYHEMRIFLFSNETWVWCVYIVASPLLLTIITHNSDSRTTIHDTRWSLITLYMYAGYEDDYKVHWIHGRLVLA